MSADRDAMLTGAVLAVFLSAAVLALWGVLETLRAMRKAIRERRPRVGLPSVWKSDRP